MKNLIASVGLFLLLAGAPVLNAQKKVDEDAVRSLPQSFCAAWAKHDGHQLSKIMAYDVDFVTVGATWIHGRPDFEKYHTRLLTGRFKDSTITLLQTEVRFLRPDVAIVHWSWKIAGDKNPDGTTREPRYGMMTMVAQKLHNAWLVVASQNDNSFPGVPPEFGGIQTPMPIPDQVGTQPSNPKN
ncbi:MAG TPA: SgcJ/EcaC family oxidoreductase [Candidatus Aquilonibacter sp.]|nr:SgcJ/EcaC family oxidoreductase [Candidatus Aquilonibacter sp.]